MHSRIQIPFFRWPLLILSALLLMFSHCGNDYTPKSRGFLRIDLPDKSYQLFDSTLPYAFEYPVYGTVVKDPLSDEMVMLRRVNIEYPNLKATLHLTYEALNQHNLDTLITDAVDFVYKHVSRASTITKSSIRRSEANVYGTVFTLRGKSTASTYQFYVTDSTRHFIRGALYINTEPNNDSLRPVIDFLKQDVDHFIQTISWK
jgi:gliding motility-associated lipoprotein GldD